MSRICSILCSMSSLTPLITSILTELSSIRDCWPKAHVKSWFLSKNSWISICSNSRPLGKRTFSLIKSQMKSKKAVNPSKNKSWKNDNKSWKWRYELISFTYPSNLIYWTILNQFMLIKFFLRHFLDKNGDLDHLKKWIKIMLSITRWQIPERQQWEKALWKNTSGRTNVSEAQQFSSKSLPP
jgi:hypothetical protein